MVEHGVEVSVSGVSFQDVGVACGPVIIVFKVVHVLAIENMVVIVFSFVGCRVAETSDQWFYHSITLVLVLFRNVTFVSNN